jgi:hypothetical protein
MELKDRSPTQRLNLISSTETARKKTETLVANCNSRGSPSPIGVVDFA